MGLTAVDNRAGNSPWAPLDVGQVFLVGYLLTSVFLPDKIGVKQQHLQKVGCGEEEFCMKSLE